MIIEIPKDEQQNLHMLLHLEEDQHHEIISALKDLELNPDINDLTKNIISKLDTISNEKALKVVPTIFRLNFTFYKTDLLLNEFIEKIFSSIDAFEISTDEQKTYKERLRDYLSDERINLIVKSSDLLTQHENVLCDEPRIFTDIRPVFGKNPKASPIGFLLIHKLKIQYIKDDEMKEIFISMDSKDIMSLKEVLERADDKAKSLTSIVNKTGIHYIDVK
jgi:hypothetical protein